VSKWTDDARRFLLEYFDTICNSPFHIYNSALPFSPTSSWLHKYYSAELSFVKVVKGLPTEWGMCFRTVFLKSFTLALSFQDNKIAVGSKPGDIIIFNAITGSQAAVLSGHTEKVNCLIFSSDGTSLVSGSDDKTVKLWDVQTGGVVKTFIGHTFWIRSVSISADCTKIASVSDDRTICLWDIQIGECCHTMRPQSAVRHINFSPTNPQHLIFISGNKVWQWDTSGHQVKPLYNGYYITFSSDGTQSVSCYGAVIMVQNSNGEIMTQFHVANSNTKCCCFSPDGRLVAVAADNTVYVWSITSSNPHLIDTFVGHAEEITSLVFSSPSSLISASKDKSVKFWQISASLANPTEADLGSIPITLPLISSISLQARGGIAISSDVDGVKTGDISISLCKAFSKIQAKDHKHGSIGMVSSKLLFIWYTDEKISIWDTEKGKLLLQADIPEYNVLDLRISGDGSKIFCIKQTSIQVWNTWTGEAAGKARFDGLNGAELLAMDDSRIWMRFFGTQPWEWDFGVPGPSPTCSYTMPPERLYLGDTKLWDNNLCRIQDIATGRVVFQLPTRYGRPVDVQWNGQYLAASFKSKEELILELHPTFL